MCMSNIFTFVSLGLTFSNLFVCLNPTQRILFIRAIWDSTVERALLPEETEIKINTCISPPPITKTINSLLPLVARFAGINHSSDSLNSFSGERPSVEVSKELQTRYRRHASKILIPQQALTSLM